MALGAGADAIAKRLADVDVTALGLSEALRRGREAMGLAADTAIEAAVLDRATDFHRTFRRLEGDA